MKFLRFVAYTTLAVTCITFVGVGTKSVRLEALMSVLAWAAGYSVFYVIARALQEIVKKGRRR